MHQINPNKSRTLVNRKVMQKRRKQRRKVERIIQIKKLWQRKMKIRKKRTRPNRGNQLASRRVRVEKWRRKRLDQKVPRLVGKRKLRCRILRNLNSQLAKKHSKWAYLRTWIKLWVSLEARMAPPKDQRNLIKMKRLWWMTSCQWIWSQIKAKVQRMKTSLPALIQKCLKMQAKLPSFLKKKHRWRIRLISPKLKLHQRNWHRRKLRKIQIEFKVVKLKKKKKMMEHHLLIKKLL